ncbi:LacI family DNA-binding transcriptional regulator [Streptomyces fulvoviolaceus]|uniref:LacI family DNA-binding transcriptional regulator n=1 Tax=Streptomyces fulvoviolaceus TaxID=285535 RepID=UPI002277FBCB|nr:LacI family DNA-binding transcriptional regulator [Streptomyces fulvoviolaceus]
MARVYARDAQSIRIDDDERRCQLMFTSKDVARLAGVSQSTVSYVMTGKRPISEETRKRVQAAIDLLSYQPNAGAQALASSRTRVIGLVVPVGGDLGNTGVVPFLEAITQCAREADYDVLLVTADEGAAGLTRLDARSLCDAIVMMVIAANDERIPVIPSLRVPVVLIGVPDDPVGLHCVDIDFTQAGRLAVEELVGTGHRRIVVVGHPPHTIARGNSFVGQFQRGVDEAAATAGIRTGLVQLPESTPSGAREVVDKALSGTEPADGLIVPHTSAIPHVLGTLLQRGMVPGRDISVVGHCTDSAAEEMEPSVTNVSHAPREISRRAMRTLFALLDDEGGNPPPYGVELVPSRLTRRATTVTTLRP